MATHQAFHLKRDGMERKATPRASMTILSKPHKFKLWTRDVHSE